MPDDVDCANYDCKYFNHGLCSKPWIKINIDCECISFVIR